MTGTTNATISGYRETFASYFCLPPHEMPEYPVRALLGGDRLDALRPGVH